MSPVALGVSLMFALLTFAAIADKAMIASVFLAISSGFWLIVAFWHKK